MNPIMRTITATIIFVGLCRPACAQQVPNPSPPAKKLPSDLALVPSDTVLLIAANLGEPWNGREAASLQRISNVHPVVPSWALKDLHASLGLQPENVERMLQFSTPAGQVAIVSTRQPYDREKVLSAFVPAAAQKSAGSKQYFYSQESTNSLFSLDERTLVLGVGQDLQAFLSRATAPQRDAALDFALEKIANGAPFVVHAGPAMVRNFAAEEKLSEGQYAALAKARAWQIVAEVDKGLAVKLIADFESKDEAASAIPAFGMIGEKLTELMPFIKANMIPFLQGQESQYPGSNELATRMATAIDATAAALKSIDVRSTNHRAGARIQIETDEPLTTAVLLLTLTPRAKED